LQGITEASLGTKALSSSFLPGNYKGAFEAAIEVSVMS